MKKPYIEACVECQFGSCRTCRMYLQNKIISGFPGIGKSYLFNNRSHLNILDSDSSKFSWLESGERNPDFPNNYIQHIKDNANEVDIILVSSHDVVRRALEDNDIPYTVVYPDISLKSEYIDRYTSRGNDKGFIDMIFNNWDKFIENLELEKFPKRIKLQSGEYLNDIIF